MIFERNECPECGSFDTEQVMQEWEVDQVWEVRICNDCPAEYTNHYGDPIKETC